MIAFALPMQSMQCFSQPPGILQTSRAESGNRSRAKLQYKHARECALTCSSASAFCVKPSELLL
jgi:hypothetical protein